MPMTRDKLAATHLNAPAPARGLAALTVVMAIFFVLALVAAYTNRNMVFEQRMASGSYRAERATAAAEAAVDWSIAMLNGGVMNLSCTQGAADATDDFRSRYLRPNLANGGYAILPSASDQLFSGCQANGAAWLCTCPTVAAPDLSVAGGNANNSAFRVSFLVPATAAQTPPGSVILQIRGCANNPDVCYSDDRAPTLDAVVNVRANLGLVKALPTPPTATLTAGGNINAAGVVVRVANRHALTGLALQSGEATATGPGSEILGPAGASDATAAVKQGDSRLRDLAALLPAVPPAAPNSTFFSTFFGMDPATYMNQPGVVLVNNCPAGGCTETELNAAGWPATFPRRVVYVDGDLTLGGGTPSPAGTDAAPLLLVVGGTLTVNAGVELVGVIYANNIVWGAGAGTASVRGAMVSATDFTAASAVTMTYDAALLRDIGITYGSFVRVPGGWNRGGA